MRLHLTALIAAALVLAPASFAMPPVLEDEPPAAEPEIVVDRVSPPTAVGAVATTEDRIKSEGADDTKIHVRCDEGVVYAVGRDKADWFLAAMRELGYTCEVINVTKPPAEEPPSTVDPRSFDKNGDVAIMWACYQIPQWLRDLGATTPHFLIAPWSIFQTDPELMAGWSCVPVMDG